ncbi:phage holin family protein [Streptomyces sp. CAU 1734]|uniref:phage holin family protein n=1 Tax=Streptomyces sp. CAU 1734 TaxID=3140360 RepID=UPI0032618FFB
MDESRWRRVGSALLRVIVVWAASTLTMLALAALLPDFRLQSADGESVTRTALTAAWGAGVFGLLTALVWPYVVRALLLVPALVLGLLVFFLNGSLLLLALRLIPDGRGDAAPETAVVVAAVMSAVASATSTAYAMRDNDAYRCRLYRIATRRRRREGTADDGCFPTPGMLFLQLDGVGHEVLLRAAKDGVMPTVACWMNSSHRLTPWRTDWSSQTGASQLGILHGSNHDVPAFRWYEKDSGRFMVSNRPASAVELQRRAVERTGDAGLLSLDGASRGNLFSGGADQAALVLSVSTRRGRSNRSRAGYFTYFSDPANAVRTALSFAAEVAREIRQATRARLRDDAPRVPRGGVYPFVRAFATVIERDVVVSAVMGDMLAGRTAVYADLVAYDEVAHHSGPHSPDATRILASLDRSLAMIAKVAGHAPRPYRIVLLSDHGQSPGETFEQAYGTSLKELVRAECGLSGSTPADPIVLASGNLGLISFPELPGRASREQIEARHPGLLGALAGHPGIGFLLVRSEEHGSVVLTGGTETPLSELTDDGPLAVFGKGTADAVRRTDTFPHVADIMVNSMYDPGTGRVHAFEQQVGSHGGLGGEQSQPFLLSPLDMSPPVEGPGAELVGAEQVHRVLRGWLRECAGPQIPLGQVVGASTAPAEPPAPAGDRPDRPAPVAARLIPADALTARAAQPGRMEPYDNVDAA